MRGKSLLKAECSAPASAARAAVARARRSRGVRMVALDFETAQPYDHVVEVGCIEMVGGELTGRSLHALVRPLVAVSPFARAVHGLTDSRLASERRFAEMADELMDFIGGSRIVAHAYHVEFNTLSNEMARLQRGAPKRERFVCTLQLARASRRFAKCGLRDVCQMLGLRSAELREGKHDALNDAAMAAQVFLRLGASAP